MFKKLNLIEYLVIALITRIVFKGASIGDALSIVPLIALQCHQNYLKSKEVAPLGPQLEKELSEMRSTLATLKIAKSYSRL
jgi:hypothetical protein